jgi:hypothetical protein
VLHAVLLLGLLHCYQRKRKSLSELAGFEETVYLGIERGGVIGALCPPPTDTMAIKRSVRTITP